MKRARQRLASASAKHLGGIRRIGSMALGIVHESQHYNLIGYLHYTPVNAPCRFRAVPARAMNQAPHRVRICPVLYQGDSPSTPRKNHPRAASPHKRTPMAARRSIPISRRYRPIRSRGSIENAENRQWQYLVLLRSSSCYCCFALGWFSR